jgi:ethanolamine utilization microcompartment shell protein EutL
MQPLRDEISNSPRRATLTNGETPRRPARRSFGSAGILEAEIVRSRDREAQAGIAISTPAPSRSGIQVVGRTAYGGASDGTGVLEVRIVILGDESEFLKRGTDVAD